MKSIKSYDHFIRLLRNQWVNRQKIGPRITAGNADKQTDSYAGVSDPHPIIIEVRGGVVQEVRNVPPGVAYEIIDHDDREEQETPQEGSSPLPPDPDELNDYRASWAAEAVKAFQETTGTYDEDALCDLLADLMHWADRYDYDFAAALIHARDHYQAETRPDDRNSP